jgi:hypothetical protein
MIPQLNNKRRNALAWLATLALMAWLSEVWNFAAPLFRNL